MILHTVNSLSLDHGGPSRSIPGLCAELDRLGYCVQILTDDITGDRLPISGTVLTVDVGQSVMSAMAGFVPLLNSRIDRAILKLIHDSSRTVIHNHGLWLPINYSAGKISRRTTTPCVITPRGMLSSWALKQRTVQKKLAWLVFQRRVLAQANVIHVTSEEELREVRELGLKQPVALIPNGVEIPSEKRSFEIDDSNYTALFISRLHEKKGLENLIHAWNIVKPSGWKLLIVGPAEAEYRKRLKLLVKETFPTPEIIISGAVSDREKWQLYREANLFVLPSYSENFGLVVGEAMAVGLPVITTTATPWKVISDEKCGWWIDMGVESLVSALGEATTISEAERVEMGKRGCNYAVRHLSWGKAAEEMSRVYQWILGEDNQPECIKS